MAAIISRIVRRGLIILLLSALFATFQMTVTASYACTGADCTRVAMLAQQQATPYPPPATAVPPTVVPPTAVPPTAVPPTAAPAYPPPGATAAPTTIPPRPTVVAPLPETSGSGPGGATLPAGFALLALTLAGVLMAVRRLVRGV
jgi:hypothetical protein